MGAIFFDTQRGFEKLRNAGVGEEQAKAQIDLFRDAMSDRLATRDDLQILDKSLNGRMDQLEKRMDDLRDSLSARMDQLEKRMDQLEKRMDDLRDSLSARMDQLEKRMDQLEKRMDDLEKRLLEWRLELRAEIAQISKNLRMHTTIVAGSMAATIIVVLAALMTLLK